MHVPTRRPCDGAGASSLVDRHVLTRSPPDSLHLCVPPARFLVFPLETLDYTNSRIAVHSHFESWGARVVKGITAGGASSGL